MQNFTALAAQVGICTHMSGLSLLHTLGGVNAVAAGVCITQDST